MQTETACQTPAEARRQRRLGGVDEKPPPLQGKKPRLLGSLRVRLDGKLLPEFRLVCLQAHGSHPQRKIPMNTE